MRQTFPGWLDTDRAVLPPAESEVEGASLFPVWTCEGVESMPAILRKSPQFLINS